MGPYTFSEPIVTQMLQDWFSTSAELFIELDRPYSGASGDFYILNSYPQVEDLMTKASPSAVCFVLRDKQCPLRGLVDDTFIQRALDWLKHGDYYIIIEPNSYPQTIRFLGDGNTHLGLERELGDLRGTEVWVGQDFKFPDEYWKENSDLNTLTITKLK